MNEPRIWAALGILAAAFAAMITVTTQLLLRTIPSSTATLQVEIASLRTELDLRFTGLQAQMDDLDRDVQAITKRVFPE